jgi:hypothetical protein
MDPTDDISWLEVCSSLLDVSVDRLVLKLVRESLRRSLRLNFGAMTGL